ncbi:MAG: hypothetical protein HY692_05555 [Cyanobacteria bacterium NC_groundwater_1444_Ag_S-0.65um_54_12]|nr:hypothetical protein [Cyanobacteria bacterium NC_groundwater_1444_Ag_S-0.65um_54_12]
MLVVLAVLAAAASAAAGSSVKTAAPVILSKRVTAAVSDVMNPDAPAWKKAPPHTVKLQSQNLAWPMNFHPSVKQLAVRCVHNDLGWIAFRLEWQDMTRDGTPRTGKFSDVAAIMFPLDPKNPPAPLMGHRPGGRVHIIQWRSDWQIDVDRGGETTIRDLYPNAVIDAPVDQVYRYADSQSYSAGRAIGNIVSQSRHFQSVQDLMAEGFGSLTPKPLQNALGKGTWRGGKWQIVIARPMESPTDPDAAPLIEDSTSFIGFALWNGSARERGASKGWAPWVKLVIE